MKRTVLIGIVLMLLFVNTAMADDSTENMEQDSNAVIHQTVLVEPCYDYLLYMTVGLEISETGHLMYAGSCRAPYQNVRMTVHLQKSGNQFLWENIATNVKIGYDNVDLEEERDLEPEEYFYRAKIIVEVLDSDRNVIETRSGYSTEERY